MKLADPKPGRHRGLVSRASIAKPRSWDRRADELIRTIRARGDRRPARSASNGIPKHRRRQPGEGRPGAHREPRGLQSLRAETRHNGNGNGRRPAANRPAPLPTTAPADARPTADHHQGRRLPPSPRAAAHLGRGHVQGLARTDGHRYPRPRPRGSSVQENQANVICASWCTLQVRKRLHRTAEPT
jgi:hypothetical protein